MKQKRQTKEALRFILDLFATNQVSYRISGGLAAKIYGSDRALADIAVELSNNDIILLLPFISEYLTYGPQRYQDDEWNLFLATLSYKGQLIDLCGTDEQYIYNKSTLQWEQERIDLSIFEEKVVFDILVRVTPKAELLSYKSKIAREVDFADINAISTN